MKYKYESTPQFILSNASDEEARIHLELTIREGQVLRGSVSPRYLSAGIASVSDFEVHQELDRPKLHEIDSGIADQNGNSVSWDHVLATGLRDLHSEDRLHLVRWLQRILPPDANPKPV